MKRLLLPIFLLSSFAASDVNAASLLCTKAGKVTVHYKNADRIRYSESRAMWLVTYNDTRDYAGAVVQYTEEAGETCRILTN